MATPSISSTSSIHTPMQMVQSSKTKKQHLKILVSAKPSSPVSAKESSCDKVLFTQALCLHIFTFLSASGLTVSSTTCRAWKRLIDNHEPFWQVLTPLNAKIFFTPLVKEQLLSLEESKLYTPLASFIDSCIFHDKKYSITLRLEEENSFVSKRMVQPFVQYGNYQFVVHSISFSVTNVEVTKKGQDPILLGLEHEGVLIFTHLAVENEFVFAFESNGRVIQWNYETGAFIQEFKTFYSKKREARERTVFETTSAQFHVKNGRIIIYSDTRGRDDNFIEVIPYRKSGKELEKSRLILNCPLFEFLSLTLQDDLVIGIAKTQSDKKKTIWIGNLVNGKTNSHAIALPRDSWRWQPVIDQNKLYLYAFTDPLKEDQLQVFDLKTKTISTRVFKYSVFLAEYVISNDLMFGKCYTSIKIGEENQIYPRPSHFCIQDLRSEKAEVEILSSKFDPENPSLLLQEFVMRAKRMIANRNSEPAKTKAVVKANDKCVIS